MAKKRPNVIPIIEDARHPQKYRMLVPMVDVVFADVAQPDQVCACGDLTRRETAPPQRGQPRPTRAPHSACAPPWFPAPSAPPVRVPLPQARIVGLNSQYFLKNGGNFVISIKASCIDSTAPPEAVFAREVKKLQEQQLKPKEQVRNVGARLRACRPCLPHAGPAPLAQSAIVPSTPPG